MREHTRKKRFFFLLSATNNFAFSWVFLKPAEESGCGLDQNYTAEDELVFFFQLSQRLASIRASAYSCSETKVFGFVPLNNTQPLFVFLMSFFFLNLSSNYLFILEYSFNTFAF